MNGQTLIKCNASTATGGTDFYRIIKRGTRVEVLEILDDRVRFIVPNYPDIVECWRADLIRVSQEPTP